MDLTGPDAKIARAKTKLDALRSEAGAYLVGPAVWAEPEQRGDSQVFVAHVEPMPNRWALDIAEIAYHARSALDQLVCAAIRHDGGTPTTASAFPIAFDRLKYVGSRNDMAPRDRVLAGVPPRLKRVVDQHQPYLSADAAGHPLAVLADLCNSDKHELLIPVVAIMGGGKVSFGEVVPGREMLMEFGTQLEVVTPGMGLSAVINDEHVPIDLSGHLVVGFATRQGRPVEIREVHQAVVLVEKVVNEFRRLAK